MGTFPLNDGWTFAKGEPKRFAPVRLPHDWLIEETQNLYRSGVGYYRRTLNAGFLRPGQQVYLRFDGVYMDSTVWVNGEAAGEWKYGCTAFTLNISGFLLKDRENELLVRVNYQAPSARWYTGAGIYRDVSLIVKNECHFVPDGVYVSTFREGKTWRYTATAETETGGRPCEVRHTLLGADENPEKVQPWSVESPTLYTLLSELVVDGVTTDTVRTRIGFRETAFTTDRGLLFNGEPVKLKGVCLHDDLGALGSAFHREALRRRLLTLKAMGANALRTAHNPPASALMELADEMGFLVLSELLDVWKRPKNEYDYARFFDAWVERDVAAWVRRDRNHPSLILWSLGNEIADLHLDAEEGPAILRRLKSAVEKHDPRRNAAVTFCSNYMHGENTQRCADIVKLIGYNYGEKLYEGHHAAHPDWVIFGSETCSTVQSRGVYHFPLSQSVLSDDDLQCSALGNSTTSWGAKSVEDCVLFDLKTPYSLGQFLWAGQDYLGEPTPYHTKNAYLGHVDTAGFPKDSYYVIRAGWTDFRTAPMVHLFPYWDFSPGQMIDVRAATNAPSAELFFDGESLGRRELAGRLIADWRVPYRPGTLTAVAYDEGGQAVARDERSSFGEASALRVEDEAYGNLHFLTVTALDAEGRVVENANRRVNVSVTDGELLALDNGDATDMEPYRVGSRRMFGGKLLAIVRADAGKTPVLNAEFDRADIPVRKIELACVGERYYARLLPGNATYDDTEWRVTDAAGINSPLASLQVEEGGRGATLVPKGDGEVYVRCSVRNGRDHAAFISAVSRTLSGYGKPFLDPYEYVSGGLYSISNVPMTNGNERGVATLRGEESHVGFRDLDFGPYGSDAFAIDLFPLESDPFTFEVWDGMPLEGGRKIADLPYDLGSVWNTYREVRYTLPVRLSGVTTLCFVFRRKVHIRGFRFERFQKAFQRLAAGECDALYGDRYRREDGRVEDIGNNVTLTYRNMDFGADGTDRVTLCWRSTLDRNAVQILFAGEAGESRQTVNLGRRVDYGEATLPLRERLAGKGELSLLFLPGCSLDLAWLRFEQTEKEPPKP